MKRILVIIPKLSGGGAEKIALSVASGLSARYKVTLLCLQKTSASAYQPSEHVRVITFSPALFDRLRGFRILRLRRKDDYEMTLLLTRFLKKTLRINAAVSFLEMANHVNVDTGKKGRTVISVRNLYAEKLKDPTLPEYETEESLRDVSLRADHIVALSEAVRDEQIRLFRAAPEKVSVIYNPCAPADIAGQRAVPVPEKEEAWFAGNTVITAGRLIYQKGQWHLIRAFREVARRDPSARLVIFGTGKLEADLHSLTEDLGLAERVVLAGHRRDLLPYLARADLFVFPSLYEGFGNILLEAMSCGLPVISADCPGGPAELLAPEESKPAAPGKKEFGILTPALSGDLSLLTDRRRRQLPCESAELALADAICDMLSDPAQRAHYQKKSRDRILDFSPDHILAMWETLLRSR